MFTGIIKEIGTIKEITKFPEKTIFKIQAKSSLKDQEIGASIAVNGVCTTIIEMAPDNFSFEAIPETLQITNLSSLKIGDRVNLESSLRLHQGIDGHLIQGHVDCMGMIEKFEKSENGTRFTIKFPKSITKFLALKGSITINGISLTISRLHTSTMSVDLIEHTLNNTNLQFLKEGDKINLEVDLIARYLKRLLDHKEEESTYEFLQERGFL